MGKLAAGLDGLGEPDPTGKGVLTETPEGGEFKDVVVDHEITDDWSDVFRLFKKDAAHFEIIDDTVRCSTWQQSARAKDGHRDVVQLYAYSARFRRVNRETIPAATVEAWRAALQTMPREPAPVSMFPGGTYTILVADPQLGKKGTAEAVANWKRGVTAHVEAARLILDDVAQVHVAFMGDEHENVVNSYGNQPHTIELNRSAQLELDYDLRVWTIKEALTLGRPLSVSSVISNHGEWTRNGSKDPVTSQGDNSSTHIARQVKKLFDELAIFGGPLIDWTIGAGDPGVVVNLSGVDAYFTHGYIEKGKGASVEVRTKSAIERQILGRTAEYGEIPLWFTAHYHHFYAQEFEGRTLFGCPAIEAERSSEYMLNQFGVWSPPGVLGLLVGRHVSRGWSNLNIF
jgi:hypothetical protein